MTKFRSVVFPLGHRVDANVHDVAFHDKPLHKTAVFRHTVQIYS